MINITKQCLQISIDSCEFIGKGREGKVYRTDDNCVLKIFKSKKSALEEYTILKKVEGSKYFPNPINLKGRYLLREYVGGISLEEYIKSGVMPKKLTYRVLCLLEEFKKYNFVRLDISSRHIFIGNDYEVKVIDPRKCYTKKVSYPKILLGELEKAKVLDDFIKGIIDITPKTAVEWIRKFNTKV